MDPITRQAIAVAGGAGSSDPLYVDDVFSTFLYVGDAVPKSIANGIDLSGEGGMVWLKTRSDSGYNVLYDTARGATKGIYANASNAEVTRSGGLTSFNSNGFSVGNFTWENGTTPARDLVSWTFRKAPGFFDVVTYTGTGSVQNISHSLGSTPGMIMVKRLDASSPARPWCVYHRSLGATKHLHLNTDDAQATSNSHWNDTEPTSSVFTVKDDPEVNIQYGQYVAYLFAHDDQSFGTNEDEAIIKCGSYSGTGSSGNLVNVGFEPQFILIKNTSTGSTNWMLLDVMRGLPALSGSTAKRLFANTDDAEGLNNSIEPSATGFTPTGGGSYTNQSGNTYIYMAIRRPHKPAEAATDVFAIDTGSASSNIPTWDSTFAVDMAFAFNKNNGYNRINSARMLGSNYVITTSTNTLASDGSLPWDSNLGWGKQYDSTWYSYMFKRAPGFFDMVAFKGNGSSSQAITHNLGVAPEFILLKNTGNYYHWRSYDAASGPTKYMLPSGANGNYTDAGVWNDTTPTATQFTVGSHQSVNQSGYLIVAYLFASQSGISKIGSYSGTGYAINVDCGFTSGARFILIKRSDSSGSWYIFDTLRGISSGNDPYYFLDTNAAQITNTDYIDPLNAGFTVTSSAPAGLNTSGGTYIFLAIA